MTYRIRSLRTGFYFACVNEFTQWVTDESPTKPRNFPTVGLATDAILDHCLDNVEIVEVVS